MSASTKFLRGIDVAAWILLVVGGFNLGFMGFFGVNLIGVVLGPMSVFARIVYGLIGVAAAYEGFQWRAMTHRWGCTGFPKPPEMTAEGGAI